MRGLIRAAGAAPLAVALLTQCFAVPANGAVLEIQRTPPDRFWPSYGLGAAYVADPGEVNHLTVSKRAVDDGQEITLNDPGALILPAVTGPQPVPPGNIPYPTVHAATHCVFSLHSATCNSLPEQLEGKSATYGASAHLGNGDDRAVVRFGRIDGGPGDDVMRGQVMVGGPGADRFFGGPFCCDFVYYDGQYAGLSGAGIVVTLDDVADDGLAGERDNVRATIDYVTATPGDDTVIGHGGENHFHGFEGDDVLAGRAGEDFLWGEAGADRLHGAAGNDLFLPGHVDGKVDVVRCGPGRDTVRGSEPRDRLFDCEKIYAN